jgi:hypothetical protein
VKTLLFEERQGYAWRMVVEAETGLKLVCCKGRRKGAPLTASPVNTTTGYQELLLDTI